jgi:hypothetical protein
MMLSSYSWKEEARRALEADCTSLDSTLIAWTALFSPTGKHESNSNFITPMKELQSPPNMGTDDGTVGDGSCSQFTQFPTELIERIMHQIDDSRLSVCLGLTCRRFYAIHRFIFPKPISLRVGSYVNERLERQCFTPCELLAKFMERRGYMFYKDRARFESIKSLAREHRGIRD